MPHADYDKAAQIQLSKQLFAEVAEQAGKPLESIYRALVIGTDPWPEGSPPAPGPLGIPTTRIPLSMHEHALVRFNEQIEVQAWVGDRFMTPEEVIAEDKQSAILGLILDAQLGLPYLFIDERLDWIESNLEPEQKETADLERSWQFWTGARFLVSRGMFHAACEDMFAAAELAVMAFLRMKGIDLPSGLTRHQRRAEWLRDNGEAFFGVSDEDAQVLMILLAARNDWRYGDEQKDGSRARQVPTELVKYLPAVEAIVRRARYEVLTALDKEQGRDWLVREL